MPVAYVGAAATVASTVNSLTSGGQGSQYGGAGGGQPYVYQPTGQASADTGFQNLIGPMQATSLALPNLYQGDYRQIYSNIYNNPYAGQAVTGAVQGSQFAPQVAAGELAGSGTLYGLSQQASPYGAQLLNTAFDPQTALYNRTQQQVMDQINANAAQSGLAGSPYAAGLAQQGLTNFNIDWQNAQLQRQLQGVQGYQNLLNAIGQGYAGGGQLGSAGINTLVGGANLPYQTTLGQYQTQQQALNNLFSGTANAYGLSQQTLGDYLNYMGLGQSAGNLALGAQQQAFTQNAALGQNLGNSLGQLTAGLGNVNWGNVFGPSTSNTPGYNPYTGSSTFGSQFGTPSDYGGLSYGF